MPEHESSSGSKGSRGGNGDAASELLAGAPPLSGDLDDIFDEGDDHGASFNDGDTPFDVPSSQQLSSLLGGSNDPFADPFSSHVGSSQNDDPSGGLSKDKSDTGGQKESASWQDDVADIPHRRELIRQM